MQHPESDVRVAAANHAATNDPTANHTTADHESADHVTADHAATNDVATNDAPTDHAAADHIAPHDLTGLRWRVRGQHHLPHSRRQRLCLSLRCPGRGRQAGPRRLAQEGRVRPLPRQRHPHPAPLAVL